MRIPMPTLEEKLLLILKVKYNDANLKAIHQKFPNITENERLLIISVYQSERNRMLRNRNSLLSN